jgi:hypothetical protein
MTSPKSTEITFLIKGLFMHRSALCLVICLLTQSLWAGGEGNGGDLIEGMFIREGMSILSTLKNTPQGHNLVNTFQLNLNELKDTLDANRIFVTEGPLYDNTGAEVDAIHAFGAITLARQRWKYVFSLPSERSRFLVFHEMLRSASVNDDSYRISIYLDAPLDVAPPVQLAPLSNRVEIDWVTVKIMSDHQPLNETKVRIHDLAGSLEFEIPQVFLRTTDSTAVKYRIEVPFKLFAGEQIRLVQAQYWLETFVSEPQSLKIVTRAGFQSLHNMSSLTYQIDQTFDGSYLIRSPVREATNLDDVLVFEIDMQWIRRHWNLNFVDGGAITRLFLFFETTSTNP